MAHPLADRDHDPVYALVRCTVDRPEQFEVVSTGVALRVVLSWGCGGSGRVDADRSGREDARRGRNSGGIVELGGLSMIAQHPRATGET